MASLEDWGWDERWAAEFAAGPGRGLLPARVIEEQRGLYQVMTAAGERAARLPGRVRRSAAGRADLPAVGDWLATQDVEGEGEAVLAVRHILPRRSKLSRKASGDLLIEQVIASNLDAVFVMTALNADFNARRLERFLTVSRESGAQPVILLNKLDACAQPEPYLEQARAVAAGTPIVALSAVTGRGLESLAEWLKPGRTVGCIGTSGVGKSTLINHLLGTELMRTAATRSKDERGRHTTTHRQLFLLPGGGVLLDTPGMREMQFWDAEQGLKKTFDEIDALAASCRFKDCRHDAEPGCAVKAAVEAGTVAAARLASWLKLTDESRKRRIAMQKAQYRRMGPKR
ncbi:MAG: ribosome small subunit-dependent GTPase A [Elusimicrobia bacterium RIFOXYD12_FULL_66_9]|nr:MAG: ribosome small subunit-dependent GTPase A [Elusimicrobia bacterium RIFOXYD12_FULL_66_9]